MFLPKRVRASRLEGNAVVLLAPRSVVWHVAAIFLNLSRAKQTAKLQQHVVSPSQNTQRGHRDSFEFVQVAASAAALRSREAMACRKGETASSRDMCSGVCG